MTRSSPESNDLPLAQRAFAAGVLLDWWNAHGWDTGGFDLARLTTDGLVLNGIPLVSPPELDAIFASATLERELRTGRKDGLGRFDEDAIAWDVATPWIDRRAQELAREHSPDCMGLKARTFKVIITHDMDRTTGFEPTAILNALLKTGGLRQSACLGLRAACSPAALARNIARLVAMERAHGVGAIYFMLAGPYGWKRFATRTDIRWKASRQIVDLVRQAGMTVGLHGSFRACELNSYGEEKDRIEQVLGAAIRTHRNHYLRFDTIRLAAQLEAAGIQVDFSAGFSRHFGFRGGHGGTCRMYDRTRARPAAVMSIPLLFMDTVLLGQDPAGCLPELRKALEAVRQVNGCVSLLFHPELFLVDPRFFDLFERVLAICHELDADLSGQWPSGTATEHRPAPANGAPNTPSKPAARP